MYAIKRELKLNNQERTLMAKHAGFSRVVYNYGLSLISQLDHKKYKGGSSNKIAAIRKVLTNYTKKQSEYQWMNELSSRVYQNAFKALQNAFNRFFKGLGDYPTFKRKKDSNSFTVDSSNGVVLLEEGKKIKIPTLGTFRLKEPLEASYVTQTFTISRKGDRWYVSFSIDAEKLPPLYHEKTKVGIDLGVKCFATLSDGTTYEAPKPMKKAKTVGAGLIGQARDTVCLQISPNPPLQEQWRNRNKQLGNVRKGIHKSKNAAKYYIRLGNRHAKIANQRRDEEGKGEGEGEGRTRTRFLMSLKGSD